MTTLTGHDAISYAQTNGLTLNKYSDPTETRATHRQVAALREEALAAGDLLQARICDLAQFGEVERSAFAELSEADQRRVATMSQEDAWTKCERVIRNAQAQA